VTQSTFLEAEFIDAASGRIFVTRRLPRHTVPVSSVVFVPPFAEEMNRTRAIVRDLGIRIAELGQVLLVPDLAGTGDSESDLEDVSLAGWSNNLEDVSRWATSQGTPVVGCVAARFGCLLANFWQTESKNSLTFSVFWQPVVSGEHVINQWFRMRLAADMLSPNNKETLAELNIRSKAGETLVCGGYPLSTSMVDTLSGLRLDPLMRGLGKLGLVEVGSGDSISPVIRRLEERNRDVSAQKVLGEPFWMSSEIVRNTQLIDVTSRLVSTNV